MELTNELPRQWRIVLGTFLGMAGGFASLYFYTSGLFIKPLAAEFGWTRGQASLGSVAALIGNVISAPIAGRVIDRFGELPVASVCAAGLATAFILLGTFTVSLASFLALVFMLTVVASGTNAVSYNRVIVRNFFKQRGLALGLTLTGTAVGAALLPPILVPFIDQFGWQLGFYILAAATVILSGSAILLLRPYHEVPSTRPDARAAAHQSYADLFRNRDFLAIGAIIFFASIAVLGMTVHLVPLLTDRGIELATAGKTASALGISILVGRLVTGYLLDRWDAGLVTCGLLLLATVGVVALWTGNEWLILPGAILIGLGVGTEGDLLAFLLGRRFQIGSFGRVYGIIYAVHAAGAGIGGVLAGAIYDSTGNYDLWLILASVALLVSGLLALLTQRGQGGHAVSSEPEQAR